MLKAVLITIILKLLYFNDSQKTKSYINVFQQNSVVACNTCDIKHFFLYGNLWQKIAISDHIHTDWIWSRLKTKYVVNKTKPNGKIISLNFKIHFSQLPNVFVQIAERQNNNKIHLVFDFYSNTQKDKNIYVVSCYVTW